MRTGDAPTAAAIIARLGLQPHPEGGHYRETFRDVPARGGRGAVTAIHYLLAAGEVSAWHRVTDAVEIWHWSSGAPLELSVAAPLQALRAAAAAHVHLGGDVLAGHHPHHIVPAGQWQSARSLGAWTLVACTVAPAFEFTSFELAPRGWTPG